MLQFWFELREAHFVKVPPPNIRESTPKFFRLGTTGCFFLGIAIPAMGFPYAGSCRAAGFGGENLAGPKTPKWEI